MMGCIKDFFNKTNMAVLKTIGFFIQLIVLS